MAKTLTRGRSRLASQLKDAPGNLDGGHSSAATQSGCAPVDLDRDQLHPDAQQSSVPGNPSTGAIEETTPSLGAPRSDNFGGQSSDDTRGTYAADHLLALYANAVDDLERVRIAAENRARSLEQVYGIAGHPEHLAQLELASDLKALEHQATLTLQRSMRQHSLGPFVKRTKGLGEKQAARLIAAIGNPAFRVDRETGEITERTVSQLRAYCGYDPKQKRRKGVQSNWNSEAKMRAYLCAESCMKQRTSPYRKVYDAARAAWVGRTDCPTCKDGICTDGHAHNHALRLVAKEILKDLWREARAIAEPTSNNDASAFSPGEAV